MSLAIAKRHLENILVMGSVQDTQLRSTGWAGSAKIFTLYEISRTNILTDPIQNSGGPTSEITLYSLAGSVVGIGLPLGSMEQGFF